MLRRSTLVPAVKVKITTIIMALCHLNSLFAVASFVGSRWLIGDHSPYACYCGPAGAFGEVGLLWAPSRSIFITCRAS